jgi:hypothetical protein
MTDPTPDVGNIDPTRIQQAFSPRETGEWETTLGLPLQSFGSSHMAAMLAWWAAKHDAADVGNPPPFSPDDVLDMPLTALAPFLNRAVERLGEAPIGGEMPLGTGEENSSEH